MLLSIFARNVITFCEGAFDVDLDKRQKVPKKVMSPFSPESLSEQAVCDFKLTL